MKRIVFLALIIFSSTLFFSQPVTFYNRKTELYGIKDEKTGKVLTLPKYRRIELVNRTEEKKSVTKFFIAYDAKKAYLIGADGIRSVSEPYDHFSSIDVNAGSFFINAGDKDALLIVGKGINVEIGWFSKRRSLIYGQDMYKVEKDGKVFFLDAKKQILSKEYFEDISEGEFYIPDSSKVFLVKKGKWGMYGMEKKQFIPCEYDTIITKDDIFLKKNGKWGIADKSGKIKQECLYESIDPFYEKVYYYLFNSDLYPVKQNGKFGILGPTGNWVIKNEYDTLIKVKFGSLFYFLKNKKMGIVDNKGKVVAPFDHDRIERSDEYFADQQKNFFYLVADSSNKGKADASAKWGTMDEAGKIIQPIAGNCVPLLKMFNYSEKNYEKYYGMRDSTLLGYIWNIDGVQKKVQLPVDSSWVEATDAEGNWFNKKVAYYRNTLTISGGKTGILDPNGKLMLPVQYDEIQLPFDYVRHEDLRLTKYAGISNASQIPERNEDEFTIDPELPFFVKQNGAWGVENRQGKMIIPCKFDSLFLAFQKCRYDAGDSAYAARKYEKRYLQCFKGKYYGYCDLKGNEITPVEMEREGHQFGMMNIDSAASRYSEYRNNENVKFIEIQERDVKLKMYDAWTTEYEVFDEMGNMMNQASKKELEHVLSGKFNLLDACGLKLLSDKWGDEIRLVKFDVGLEDPHSLAYDLRSKLSSMMPDSLFDRETKGRMIVKKLTSEVIDEYFDQFFMKHDGKWFVYRYGNTKPLNEGAGFDSVISFYHGVYKVFVGKKHAYYLPQYKGTFDREADVIFPDLEIGMRVAARTNAIVWHDYFTTEKGTLYNDIGEELRDTIYTYKYQVPQIKEGKFNVLNERSEPVFKEWADKIIFPANEKGKAFDFSDEKNFIFEKEHGEKLRDYSAIYECKKSVALKYGEEWYLSSASNPTVLIGKFKEIKLEGNKWACLKKKKIVYYTVDGLVKVD